MIRTLAVFILNIFMYLLHSFLFIQSLYYAGHPLSCGYPEFPDPNLEGALPTLPSGLASATLTKAFALLTVLPHGLGDPAERTGPGPSPSPSPSQGRWAVLGLD